MADALLLRFAPPAGPDIHAYQFGSLSGRCNRPLRFAGTRAQSSGTHPRKLGMLTGDLRLEQFHDFPRDAETALARAVGIDLGLLRQFGDEPLRASVAFLGVRQQLRHWDFVAILRSVTAVRNEEYFAPTTEPGDMRAK